MPERQPSLSTPRQVRSTGARLWSSPSPGGSGGWSDCEHGSQQDDATGDRLRGEFVYTINGNAPGSLSGIAIGANGILSFQYGNGASQNAYVIPLANVPSPDNLTTALGDAYQTNNASGALQVGNPGSGGLGSVDSASLELSTVDLATELTSLVEAQSSYQANSKVFQTGSDILSILKNLKS